MSLIKWSPIFDMDPFEEMEQMLNRFPRQMAQSKGFAPAMDVYQTENEVIVETPLPGIDPNNVEVSVENDVLTVKGKMEKKTEVDEKDYYRKEVRYGSFYRSMALPAHVKSDNADAEYKDGVLKITLPKAEEVKAQKISVKSS